MIDIKTKFDDVIRNDTALQALLGGTPQDPRIYPYYQGDAQITPTKPGFITYSVVNPETLMAVEMPVVTLAVWTREWLRAEQVAARLEALFDQQIHVTAAPDSRRLYTKVLNVNDAYQQEPRYAGKNMHILASWSRV